MKIVLFSIAAIAAMSSSAAADDCKQISSDLDRLACYDKESGRTAKQERIVSKTPSKWSLQKETSKMSDRTNVYMTVQSNEIINCGWNRGDKISLSLMCRENKTSVVFDTGCHMTSSEYNDYGDIQYRIDQEKARTVSATETTNNRALGLWSGGKSIPFIKSILGKNKLLVRMTPYGENPFTATFDISGADEGVKAIRSACGW
uniref:type VI secretion system-associated protein TagO n=1 Tax=Brucella pseudintermedia TaxID=370111 RepID=UPI00158C2962|nr:type VI secretion system-associated protein TagO [Brucella pseudintermedia]